MYYQALLLYGLVARIQAIFTTPPVWITSNYVRAGNENVIHSITNQLTTPVPSHTFNFSSPLTGTPNLGYGIKGYEGYDYLGQEIFQINRTYLDRFQFSVVVKIIGVTNILLLNVPYIAIDPSFPHHLNSFDNVPVNYGAGALVNITVASTTVQTYTNVINYTTQAAACTHNTFLPPFSRNKVLLFLTSMDFHGTVENNNPPPYRPVNLHVSAEVTSVDEYKIVVTLSKQVYVNKLHFSMIIFDKTDVESTQQYLIVYDVVELPYTGGFVRVPAEFVDNFILGLISFTGNKTCVILDFQWDFANVSGVHGALMPLSVGQTNKVYGTQTVNTVSYTLFYLKTWLCPNQTYFDPAQDLCTGCPIINCIDCYNLTVCTNCDQLNDFFLDAITFQCVACSLVGCVNCTDLSTCQTCNQSAGYLLESGLCQFDCSIIDNCSINETNSTDQATLYKPSYESYTKSGCNQFTYKFNFPDWLLANCLDSAYIEDAGLSILSVSIHGSEVQFEVGYFRDIYKENISLLVPCSGHLYRLSLAYNPMVPPLYYSVDDCAASDNIANLLTAVEIISYILLIMSLLSCKIVGLELFGVLQLAYFSLGSYDYYPIYLHPLTEFKTFNGLNIPFISESAVIPQSLQEMKLASSFLNNFNIMFILYLAELAIAVSLLILSKLTQSYKMKKLGLRLLKQGFVTLVLFNVFNISFSAGVDWKFSVPGKSDYGLNEAAIVVTLLSIFISLFALEYTGEEEYGEFKNKFKDTCVCKVYVFLSILYRLTIGLYLALHTDYPESTLLVLAFSLCFIMYNIVNLPFTSALQNYRCNLVHVTQLVTLVGANYYREMKMYAPMAVKARVYAPAVLELILIVLCIAFSAIVLVYQIVLQIRQWFQNRKVSAVKKPQKIHDQSNETMAAL